MNPWKKKSGVAVVKSDPIDPIEQAFLRSLLILIQRFFRGRVWMAKNNKKHPFFTRYEESHEELSISIIQCCFRFYSWRKNRSSKVGWKYNEDLHQLVRCQKKPVFDPFSDDYDAFKYTYNDEVKKERYCDYVTYWDNEAQEFWAQWEEKPRSVD